MKDINEFIENINFVKYMNFLKEIWLSSIVVFFWRPICGKSSLHYHPHVQTWI